MARKQRIRQTNGEEGRERKRRGSEQEGRVQGISAVDKGAPANVYPVLRARGRESAKESVTVSSGLCVWNGQRVPSLLSGSKRGRGGGRKGSGLGRGGRQRNGRRCNAASDKMQQKVFYSCVVYLKGKGKS